MLRFRGSAFWCGFLPGGVDLGRILFDCWVCDIKTQDVREVDRLSTNLKCIG